MKKILTLIPLIAILVFSCGKKEKTVNIEKGTKAYTLAETLAVKIPKLNPKLNAKLIKTKNFNVTVGETIDGIIQNFGSRANQLPSIDIETIKSIIMSNAIDIAEKKLLEKESIKAGFDAPQSKIDSIMQLQYDAAKGKEAFEMQLVENGIEQSVVKESIRSGILINALLQDKIKEEDIVVTEAEIRALYVPEKARAAQHILIDTREDTTATGKAKALKEIKSILAEAKLGKDFGELAKKHSSCPSREKGGDLGKFSRGQMVSEFDQAVFSMNVGEISDVVETQFGYHIIKLNEIVKNDYNDVKSELETRAKDNKKRVLYQEYMQELKKLAEFEEIGL